MIKRLLIESFKRFESETLEFRPLTVLAGRNGSGKTSALHALLLARHAAVRNDGIAQLNGPFGIELGWFEDLVNANADEEKFSVFIEDYYTNTMKITFTKGDSELYAKTTLEKLDAKILSVSNNRSFQYLSAERNGPRITQQSAPLPIDMLEVGCSGEYVAQILEKLGSAVVPTARALRSDEGEEPALVKAQTEKWLSRIVRNIEIDTTSFSGTDVVSLRFRTDGASMWVRPTNMGFGVSYTLPVVVAAMTAAEDGLIIVENPEAHLHPAGQSEMGMFLAQMASSGLQIILETHSDHVLNGIRRAIGDEHLLLSENAIVHFFPDASSEAQPLEFTANGGITQWPAGFFDQYRIDVARITAARRSS